MADSFAGAEGQIDQDKMSALNTVATFGRQGMEQAVLAKKRASEAQTGLAQANATQPWANTMRTGYSESRQNLNQAQVDALAAIGAKGAQAYTDDAAGAQRFLGNEQGVAQKVNANFYGQVKQAIPGMRANAGAVEDEYRAAYEQRQADFAAAQQAQALQRQQAAMELAAIQQRAEIERQMFLASPEGQATIADYVRAMSKGKTGMAVQPGQAGQAQYRRG